MLYIIGDIHSCLYELVSLTSTITRQDGASKFIFVGDLIDRGPYPVETLEFIMCLCDEGVAQVVEGNHDAKLKKYLNGQNIRFTRNIQHTINQIECAGTAFTERVRNFLNSLPLYLEPEPGLIICHGGMDEKDQARKDNRKKLECGCLYGYPTGKKDKEGLPIRTDWAHNYRGEVYVVHGHVVIKEPQEINRVINIDTGCCFGNKLTAIAWPSKEYFFVKAYAEYVKRENW